MTAETDTKKSMYKTARVKRDSWYMLPDDHYEGFVRVKYEPDLGMFTCYTTMSDDSLVGTMREDRLENFCL